jgi:hypothetical protein
VVEVVWDQGENFRTVREKLDKFPQVDHTRGIENLWSLLKRSLRGTYVCVEPFHLGRYVSEQVFGFNNRAIRNNPLNDADRFDIAVRQIVGKRITFAELTGKPN